MTPLLLLDVDDVLCLQRPFGGKDVEQALRYPQHAPSDLYEKLFAPESVEVLNGLMKEFAPQVVLTTTWLRLLDRSHFIHVFTQCRLEMVARSLHQHWAAQQDVGMSRLDAVTGWLRQHHRGEPVVVIDDEESGASLIGAPIDKSGRVVLCKAGEGLRRSHIEPARRALQLSIYQVHSGQ